MDTNGVTLGFNKLGFIVIGTVSNESLVVGKTSYDFYPEKVDNVMMSNIKKVEQEKRSSEVEESIIDVTIGEIKWFLTTRAPLLDDYNKLVLGLICTAVEITDRKRVEYLERKNEMQKVKL
jgi:PAS domain-containing protein